HRAPHVTTGLGVVGSVRYLRNVMGLWILDEGVREWTADAARGDSPPVDLASLLEQAADEPGGRCLLAVDGDELLAPGGMPGGVRAAIRRAGADVPDARAALARVVLDSLADAYAGVVLPAVELAAAAVSYQHVVAGARPDL